MIKRSIDTARNLVAPVVVFVLMILLWHWVVVAFSIPNILLPSPTSVLKAGWQERTLLLKAVYTSGIAALCAFIACGVIGLLIAISFSLSAWVRRAFFPYVIFLQTVPIVAIAPLLIIWSGYNFRTIVLVAVIIGLFPVVSNTTNSLLFVPALQQDLFRVYSASRWHTLWKLQLPSAVPSWALGMKISSGLVVIGAIVGEFFVGNGGAYEGLGSLITRWQGRQYTAGLIAAVAATTVLGLAFFGIAQVLGKNVLRKWTRGKL